jgi:hypothetical protein
MRRPIVTCLLVMGAAASGVAGVANATPVLSIGSDSISSGGTATVDLDVSGLGSGTALGAFDVSVGFNSSVVGFKSAAYGDPVLGDQLNLEGFGTLQGSFASPGSAELFELSLDSPAALTSLQATSFTLATLTFTGLTSGVSDLSLSVNALGDQNGNALPATLENGAITVGSGTTVGVTEPGQLALLLSGVAAMGLVMRRRTRS